MTHNVQRDLNDGWVGWLLSGAVGDRENKNIFGSLAVAATATATASGGSRGRVEFLFFVCFSFAWPIFLILVESGFQGYCTWFLKDEGILLEVNVEMVIL